MKTHIERASEVRRVTVVYQNKLRNKGSFGRQQGSEVATPCPSIIVSIYKELG